MSAAVIKSTTEDSKVQIKGNWLIIFIFKKNPTKTYFKVQNIPLAKYFDFAKENKSPMTERGWTVLRHLRDEIKPRVPGGRIKT